jgi:hypothetical protein
VDLVCIGGDRIFEAMLPRMSIFGAAGPLFHITGLRLHTVLAVLALMATCLIFCAVLLSVVLREEIEGADWGMLYWIVPAVSQATAMVVVAGTISTALASDETRKSPNWATTLQLHAQTDSRIGAYNLVQPMLWMHFLLATSELHTALFIQVHGHTVWRSDKAADVDSEVLILDPYLLPTFDGEEQHDNIDWPPPSMCTQVVTADILHNFGSSQGLSLQTFWLVNRRLPRNKGQHDDGKYLGAFELVVDFLT